MKKFLSLVMVMHVAFVAAESNHHQRVVDACKNKAGSPETQAAVDQYLNGVTEGARQVSLDFTKGVRNELSAEDAHKLAEVLRVTESVLELLPDLLPGSPNLSKKDQTMEILNTRIQYLLLSIAPYLAVHINNMNAKELENKAEAATEQGIRNIIQFLRQRLQEQREILERN